MRVRSDGERERERTCFACLRVRERERERERERGDKRRLGPFVPMSKNCFPKL